MSSIPQATLALIGMSVSSCALPSVESSVDAPATATGTTDAAARPNMLPDAGDHHSDAATVVPASAGRAAAADPKVRDAVAGSDAANDTAGAGAGGRAGVPPSSAGNAAAGRAGNTTSAAGAAAGVAGMAASAGASASSPADATPAAPLMFTGPFTMGSTIASKYKCMMDVVGGGMGNNVSPPFSWRGGPAETKSFAIVLYDTGFNMLHWVLWDIPPQTNDLPEGLAAGYALTTPTGAHQAASMGMDRHAYYGPCTGGSLASTYEFRLYSLKQDKLTLTESSTATEAMSAVESAMLEKAVWGGKPQ